MALRIIGAEQLGAGALDLRVLQMRCAQDLGRQTDVYDRLWQPVMTMSFSSKWNTGDEFILTHRLERCDFHSFGWVPGEFS